MNTTTTQARQAIRRYIELRGFEVIEDSWAYGQDAIDYIARDGENGDLVFVATETHHNVGGGIPKSVADRKAFERLAAAYLASANTDIDECAVRLDVVSLLVLNESRGIIRHYRNAVSEAG